MPNELTIYCEMDSVSISNSTALNAGLKRQARGSIHVFLFVFIAILRMHYVVATLLLKL